MGTSDIQFSSVKDAIRWSEEVASIPDVKSVLGALVGKPSSGRLSKQDVIEIAQTISHITAQVKPFAGLFMKTILGRSNEQHEAALALVIASRLMAMPEGQKKEPHQLKGVGVATIRFMRETELYGKRFPVRVQAKIVGVSRERYTNGMQWQELRLEAFRMCRLWMERADKAIYPELKSRGWIG